MIKLLACDLGPNIFFFDVLSSLGQLIFPSGQRSVNQLEEVFTKDFGQAVAFNSGRSALLAILKSLNLKRGDEVLLQAYTCVAVPDAVLWADLKPVFVDIEERSLGMNPFDFKNKITKRSKVLIIQHTFGIPAKVKELLTIARKNNLVVVEDCAHALGIKYQGKLLGRFGDLAFFSFGRDKIISGVFGGMVTTKDKELVEKLRKYQQSLNLPSLGWTLIQLIYNPLIYFITRTYYLFYLGKVVHFLCLKLNLLSKAVLNMEKKGLKPPFVPKRMPSQLAQLASYQLSRLDDFNQHRLKLTQKYANQLKGLPLKILTPNQALLRFIIFSPDRDQIKNFARLRGVSLDSWYDLPVAPKDTELSAIGYTLGSCPVAEKLSSLSLNLPTNPNLSMDEADYVISVIKKYYA